jgi:hypothetical protein
MQLRIPMSVQTIRSAALACGVMTVCLAGVAAPAQAVVIFDNTNNLTNTATGGGSWAVRPLDYSNLNPTFIGQTIGFQFTSQANATLNKVDVRAIGSGNNNLSSINFTLYSDNSNQLGSALASFSIGGFLPTAYSYRSATTFSTTPTLLAGSKYWLVASTPLGLNGNFAWGYHSGAATVSTYVEQPAPTGIFYAQVQQSLFQVSGTPATVPVPPQLLATAVGAGLGALKLRRQKLA